MVRQSVNTQPWIKHLEIYNDFSGGANTSVTDSSLRDNELTYLKNVDIDDRGTLKRRTGMKRTFDYHIAGKGQGMFVWRGEGRETVLAACNGKLYLFNNVYGGDPVLQEMQYADFSPVTFQSDRMIDAVMFGNKMYIATGDPNVGLLEYDGGEYINSVEVYQPNGLEALYIGINAMSATPDTFLTSGEAAFLRVDGVVPYDASKNDQYMKYGVVNKDTWFKVYVSKPASSVVEYRFEYRKMGTDTWGLWEDWATDNTHRFRSKEVGDWELRFLTRIQGDTATEEYYIPQFSIKETDEENEAIERYDVSELKRCNRILAHWQRLVLYDDSELGKSKFYVSHIDNAGYFPMSNTLSFDIGYNDRLTSIVPFRDMLVVFKENSIQAVYGNGPIGDNAYRRVVLNTSIGCVAPRGATVVGNHVMFYSKDGVYRLKSLGYTQDQANVEKMDSRIKNLIPLNDETAIAYYEQNQFHILVGGKRFRYYTLLDAWVCDESTKFVNPGGTTTVGLVTYLLATLTLSDGTKETQILQTDSTSYLDEDHVYETTIETKMYDFGQPHHPKKLKELQLLLGSFKDPVNIELYVYADNQAIINPETSEAVVQEDGSVVWVESSSPNVSVPSGTIFGSWQLGLSPFGSVDSSIHYVRLTGMCKRTKISIHHNEAKPMSLLGLGYIFKLKRA